MAEGNGVTAAEVTTRAVVRTSDGVANRPDILAILKTGDIGKLNNEQQLAYYMHECARLGLDPAARPLEFMTLNGKVVLYAKRIAGDMLAAQRNLSLDIVDGPDVRKFGTMEVLYAKTKATSPNGRSGVDIATRFMKDPTDIMKVVTASYRRTTLRLCGWGGPTEDDVEELKRKEAEVPEEIKDDVKAILSERGVSEIQLSDAGFILDSRRDLISADNLDETNEYLRLLCPAKTSKAAVRKARAEAEAKRESAASTGAKVTVQMTPDGPVQAPPAEAPAGLRITAVETPAGSVLKVETPAATPAPMAYDGRLAASIVISLDLAPDTKTLNDVWNTSVVSARAEERLSDPDMTMLEKAYDARMEKVATPAERLNAVLNDFSTAADKADIDAANAAYAALKLVKGSAEDKLCAETSVAARRRLGLPVKGRAPKADAPTETPAPTAAPLGTAKEPTLPGIPTAPVVATPDTEREAIAAESSESADAFGESEPDPFADDAPAEPDPNTGLAAPIDTAAWTARMQNANAKHIINSLAYHWPEFADSKAAGFAAVGLLAPSDRKPLLGIVDVKDARAQLKAAVAAKETERAQKAGA